MHEQLPHDLDVPMLGSGVQGGETRCILEIGIRTGFNQQLDHRHAALQRGKVQRRRAVPGAGVEVGLLGYQHFGHGEVSGESGPQKRRAAVRVGHLDVRVPSQQQFGNAPVLVNVGRVKSSRRLIGLCQLVGDGLRGVGIVWSARNNLCGQLAVQPKKVLG